MDRKEAIHLSDDEIEFYVDFELQNSGGIFDEKILRIEKHIIDCDSCAKKVSYEMKFAKEWEMWLHTSHKKNNNGLILGALEVLHTKLASEEIKNKVERWISTWKGYGQAAMKVLFDEQENGIRKLTGFIFDGMKGLTRPDSDWVFDYSTVLEPARDSLGDSLERKKYNEVFLKTATDLLTMNMKIKKSENKLEIIFSGLSEYEELPLVLLVSEVGSCPDIREFAFNDKEKKWVCIFDNLKKGRYTLAFEPVEL